MIRSQNMNSSVYVTISTAPFRMIGGKEAAPAKEANRLPYLGSTRRRSAAYSISQYSP